MRAPRGVMQRVLSRVHTVYSTALWPGMARGLPSGPKRPMRGPATQAPARPATPPTMCTAPEPTVSYTPAQTAALSWREGSWWGGSRTCRLRARLTRRLATPVRMHAGQRRTARAHLIRTAAAPAWRCAWGTPSQRWSIPGESAPGTPAQCVHAHDVSRGHVRKAARTMQRRPDTRPTAPACIVCPLPHFCARPPACSMSTCSSMRIRCARSYPWGLTARVVIFRNRLQGLVTQGDSPRRSGKRRSRRTR